MAHGFLQLIVLLFLAVDTVAPGGEPLERQIRFRVFSPNPEKVITYMPSPEGRVRRLEFYPTQISATYSYHGAMPLVFWDDVGVAIAGVALPEEENDVLLLFIADGEAGSRRKVIAIDVSERNRPPGSLTIANFSRLKLTGTYRGRSIALVDGLNPSLAGASSAGLVLRAMVNGRAYQSFADSIPVGGDERKLLILFPPFTRGSIEPQWRLLEL